MGPFYSIQDLIITLLSARLTQNFPLKYHEYPILSERAKEPTSSLF